MHCDLSSLASIRAFAAQLLQQEQNIDIMVLNAAIRGCPMVRMLMPPVRDASRLCNDIDSLFPAGPVVLPGGI